MQPLPISDLSHVLDAVRPDLEALAHSRILMTGGTGFLGRWMLESWVLARREGRLQGDLVVLTRHPERWRQQVQCPGLSFRGGDLADLRFPEGPFSHVVHGAMEHGDHRTTFWKTLQGCQHLLEGAVQAGVARFLFLSSGAVYGRQTVERVPETCLAAPDPMDPRQAYGQAKRACESLGMAFQADGGPAFVSARGFAFVGPGLPLQANYAIGNFIGQALKGGPLVIEGDGTPLRSYLYAADAAAWHWALLVRGSGAVNVGGGEEVSIRDLATRVRDLLAPDAEVQVRTAPVPGAAPARYVPDISRAEALGLKPWTDLERAIRQTAAWQMDGEAQ